MKGICNASRLILVLSQDKLKVHRCKQNNWNVTQGIHESELSATGSIHIWDIFHFEMCKDICNASRLILVLSQDRLHVSRTK